MGEWRRVIVPVRVVVGMRGIAHVSLGGLRLLVPFVRRRAPQVEMSWRRPWAHCTRPPAPMEEVPDGKYMRLWGTAYGHVHTGAGEWQLLEGHAELSIVDGQGVLRSSATSGAPEVEWAAHLMTKALVRASPEDGGELCDFVYDTKSKSKIRWDIEFGRGLTRVAQRFEAGSSEVYLEAFVSTLPRRERFVRCGLSRLVCHGRGNTRWPMVSEICSIVPQIIRAHVLRPRLALRLQEFGRVLLPLQRQAARCACMVDRRPGLERLE